MLFFSGNVPRERNWLVDAYLKDVRAEFVSQVLYDQMIVVARLVVGGAVPVLKNLLLVLDRIFQHHGKATGGAPEKPEAVPPINHEHPPLLGILIGPTGTWDVSGASLKLAVFGGSQ
jgi:hypothetical protein